MSSHITNLEEAALECIAAGLSVIPLKNNEKGEAKVPAVVTWTPYREPGNPVTPEIFRELISHPAAKDWRGLAVICGPTSGGLECIDVDLKHDPEEKIVTDYLEAVKAADLELFNRLAIASTPSGGIHVYYRRNYGGLKAPNENQGGLAYIPNPTGTRGAAIIETRLWGRGYVSFPPTEGRAFIQGGINSIPVITDEERALLFAIARSFSRYVEPVAVERPAMKRSGLMTGDRPGDHYNRERTIEDVLNAEGWKTWPGPRGQILVRHPDASNPVSGNIVDLPKHGPTLWMWSTSSGLPSEKALVGPFVVYAWLKHGGDYTEAAKDLRRQGYGSPGAGEIRTTRASVSIRKTSGEEIELAPPGGFTTVTEATGADVGIVYIDSVPEAEKMEIWQHIQALDVLAGPEILVRMADPSTGEVGPGVLSSLWMLHDILGPYQEKTARGEELTNEDQAAIIARLSNAVRITKNRITRDRLIGQAIRWTGWEALDITREGLQEKLDLLSEEAAREARMDELDRLTADIVDARERGDMKALGALSKQLSGALTPPKKESIGIMETANVKHSLINRKPGLTTPWKALNDKNITLTPGSMAVVGARPGVGKTAFMVNMATHAAVTNQDRVFYYVFYEEGPVNFYVKLVRHFAAYYWPEKIIAAGLNGTPPTDEPGLFSEAIQALDVVTNPRTGSLRLIETRPTLEAVQEHLRDEAARGVNIGGLFVDHATIVKTERQFREIRERLIHVSQVMQEIAIERDIPVIISTQMNRDAAKGKPDAHNIKESDALLEDAALLMLLSRTEEGNQDIPGILVNVAKIRDAGAGEYELNFYPPAQQIFDLYDYALPLMKRHGVLRDWVLDGKKNTNE